jgi:hypothetical protein
MSNHPNRNRKRRWRVDLFACAAIHDSGLTVVFHQTAPGEWSGDLSGAWPESLDIRDAARLMREAGDIYTRALNDRH